MDSFRYFKRHLKDYRHSAKKRGLEFSLTIGQFKKLTSQHCYYCGKEPERRVMKTSWRDAKGELKKTTKLSIEALNGIDRVDPALGYEMSNCVPCCTRCNVIKYKMLGSEMVEHLCQMLMHLSKRGLP